MQHISSIFYENYLYDPLVIKHATSQNHPESPKTTQNQPQPPTTTQNQPQPSSLKFSY